MTYEQLQMNGLPISESELRQSSQQGFPANLTALQEKVSAIVTIVTSGERLQELSEKFVRAGSSGRIRPVYSQEAISGTSVECLTTLPRWGIRLDGEYGALVTSALYIEESEYSFLPTPTASDGLAYTRISKKNVQRTIYRQHHSRIFGAKSQHTKRLIEYLAYFGTPLNRICELYEMIMGFPLGWTDLDALEAP